MITITQFFLKYLNKPLDSDGAYGAQCVDVIRQYFIEVLGIKPIQGNAIDYWKDIPGFTRIKRSAGNPIPGDIIIWDKPYGQFGHIAVCNWTTAKNIGVFEQNNPLKSPCHYGTHAYDKILGYQRFNNRPAEAPRPVPVPTPKPLTKKVFKAVVIGPQKNDQVLLDGVSFVNSKLLEFSGGFLGFEIIDQVEQVITDPTPATYFVTDDAVPVLKNLNYKIPYDCDYVLVRYQGSSVWTYTVLYDSIWPVPFTIMPSNWGDIKDPLLFEVGHALINLYNKRRGTLPSISNFDNYTGGESYVKAKVQLVLPYLDLYDQPIK